MYIISMDEIYDVGNGFVNTDFARRAALLQGTAAVSLVCVYTCTCIYLCTYIPCCHSKPFVHIFVHVHVYVYVYVRICLYICVYIYVCMCVCVYIYIYIYTHTHTYTHIHAYTRCSCINTHTRTCTWLQGAEVREHLTHVCVHIQSIRSPYSPSCHTFMPCDASMYQSFINKIKKIEKCV
jgi:hypothetical protein